MKLDGGCSAEIVAICGNGKKKPAEWLHFGKMKVCLRWFG
jgi:hypothetical protein